MDNKYVSGLGYQTTVGEVIQKIFPVGFLINAYRVRQIVRDKSFLTTKHGKDIATIDEAMLVYKDILKNEKSIRKKVSQEVEKIWKEVNPESEIESWRNREFLNNKMSKDEFSEYFLAPPYSPFDLFAICGVLLRDSGAYHHIETSSHHDNENPDLGRIIVSTSKEREILLKIGEDWRFPEDKNNREDYLYDVTLPDSALKYWAGIIAAWDLPIFQPRPESDSHPKWWESAYKLLCIADQAARDSGIAELSIKRSKSTKPAYGGFRRGGFWSSHVAYFLSDKREDPAVELFFEALCKKNNIKNFEYLEWGRRNINTLSAANRDEVCILPKLRTPQVGCTIRSLSHNLSLLPARGFVRALWTSQSQNYLGIKKFRKKPFNLVIVPYPYDIRARQFKQISRVDDDQKFGSFKFEPDNSNYDAISELRKIINYARERVGTVHGIVYPELALSSSQFQEIFQYVRECTNVELLCAGTNQRVSLESLRDSTFPINEMNKPHQAKSANPNVSPCNEALMVSFKRLSREDYQKSRPLCKRPYKFTSHQKHHRWRLTTQQIIDYGLSPALDPSVIWWEDLKIRNRKLPFMLMRDKWAVATLICEDLARVDPAQQLVRAIGPNLILSLVMDGPQIDGRWSSRYATVLADDPGSAVLTVNSTGLIKRTMDVRSLQGFEDNKEELIIGLWKDDESDNIPIALPSSHIAACLTLYEHAVDEFTLDGRRNSYNSVALRLGNHFTIPHQS